MFVIPYLITIVYGFCSNFFNIKYKNRFFWMWCGLLLCLLSNTTSAVTYADYNNYNLIFRLSNIGLNFTQVSQQFGISFFGWYWLCRLFYNIGLNYRGMQLIVIFTSCFLLHRAIIKYKGAEMNSFWGFFLLFPAILCVIQIRFFLASSIIFWGFSCFYGEKNPKIQIFKYLFAVILAGSIHTSCYFFIILAVIPFINNINIEKINIITVGVFSMILVVYNFVPTIAAKFTSTAKIDRYFYAGQQIAGFHVIFFTFFVWLIVVQISKYCIKSINFQMISHYNLLILLCSLSGLGGAILLMWYDASFYRFIQVALLFGIMLVSSFISNMSFNNLGGLVVVMAALLLVMTFMYTSNNDLFAIFRYEGFNTIFRIM